MPESVHPRGVYREPFSLNGCVVFHAYRCDGAMIAMAMIHPDCSADLIETGLVQGLDENCPVHDAIAHRGICPADRSRLRVV